ncbi:uncharacterized protein [Watersipora subatra]|uniref:uncharacterized protein n=1 Tax=Watersipora subatra TaxID=2589382 RepID=UPI00355BAB1F
MATSLDKKIVIVGGGMMGCSTAYHLTCLGAHCTLVERTSIACAASGKAGGFLARSWCDGTASGPLARASFELHKQYGAEFDCDFRPVDTLELSVDALKKRKGSLGAAPEWIDKGNVRSMRVTGSTSDTAQVHPRKLCESFMRKAEANGCSLVLAEVTGVEFSPTDSTTIQGVRLADGQVILCDILVLTLGPWTNLASQWFDYRLPPIGAERAHSIVVTPKVPVTAHALFLEYKDDAGFHHPEVYSRPDGTVYLCGFNDSVPLPESADQIKPNEESLCRLQRIGGQVSSVLQDCELLVGQACYLPIPPESDPIIGKVPHYNGQLYIAAGHYCWGILNGPATGKGLAELIVNGNSSIDLSPFEPANFL